ncbi:putative rossmann-like alpha/beta/alpha sandwich protein [Medicago truncatula]|uniref:DUF4408 domain protein n=1 Tax=Medicago truncatula TaxID=3880 RepID=G7K8L0_MEDTR|nr:uncharacterized protein LOC11429994 [Medicago truncatula]AET00563.1 DUF4408 domain protein [Medicago truncatula]RHN57825.1 putative rossmann-like alpha/beta/alpha sandwich protein [Medicago truncatula]
MTMNKVNKSQVIVLSILLLLLVITPLLPSSLRPTYLYLIFNILIIALGAEAGLLSVLSEPSEDKKQHVSVTQPKHEMLEQEEKEASNIINNAYSVSEEQNENKPKVVEKSVSEKKIVYVDVGVSKVDKVKKCPSMPSIFFIEDGEDDLEVKDEEVEVEDEICGVNGQELFAKAEAFIGNFYKQLKMQREECWDS